MRGHTLDKLTILRREDHFRAWQSLDDMRECALCGKNFSGHEVVVLEKGDHYELQCPTLGCQSRVHEWVFTGNPSISEKAYPDWWKALGDSADNRAQAV
jgi:hypothetical protein